MHQPGGGRNDLDGATPLERLAYLAARPSSLTEIDELLASAESDPENALDIWNDMRRIGRT